MPWWTTVLIALGGLLIGGAYSAWKQKFPIWVTISFVVLGIMAVIGGFLMVPSETEEQEDTAGAQAQISVVITDGVQPNTHSTGQGSGGLAW